MSNLKDIINKINAEEGATLLQSLENSQSKLKDGLSSGSFNLNFALSGNPLIGFAWGRVVEILGPEATGKSTFCLTAIREAQKKGYLTAFIDAEHAVDPVYAKSIGVDLDKLIFSQPDYGEQAITAARLLLKEGVKLIIIDSVAALTPKAELEGETGDSFMGKQARLMGQAMRQIVPLASKAKAVVIFTNQIRMKIGIAFGNPETSTGGLAIKFFSSYRLMLRAPRGGAEKEKLSGGEVVETGIDTNITVIKNKLFPPFRKATVHIEYGKGIEVAQDAANFLVNQEGDGSRVVVKGKSYTEKKLAESIRKDSAIRSEVGKMIQGYGSKK